MPLRTSQPAQRAQSEILTHPLALCRCGILKCCKLKNYFFYSFSLFFLSLSIFSHKTGQKSAYQIGETDSTAQFTLWSPWTATSQTPWIRSYTPSLATFSTYHQSPLSFTYHIPYTISRTLHNQHNNILIQHTTYNNPSAYINNPYTQSHGHARCMRAHADLMQCYADRI